MGYPFSWFFFLKALILLEYDLLSAGRWRKHDYDQIHDGDRAKARSDKAFKKGFDGFCILQLNQSEEELFYFLKHLRII